MRFQWLDAQGVPTELAPEIVAHHNDLDEHRYEVAFDTNGVRVNRLVVFPELDDDAFQLLSLQIDIDTPSGLTTLHRVASGSDDLSSVAVDGLRMFQVNGFTYFMGESGNAALRLKVEPHELGVDDHYRLRVRVLVLDASYVASFREHFLTQLRKSERRIAELEGEVERLGKAAERAEVLHHELQVLKTSRIWRMAEQFRRMFYHRALAPFPVLRGRLLGLSRRKVRKSFDGARELGALSSNRIKNNPRDEAYQALVDWRESQRASDASIGKRIEAFALKPLISVIMPVHDTPPQWLQAAIESVLGQRYRNFELCICDDASVNPDTIECLASFKHPRMRITRLDTGAHISGATNHALELATGDYVAFLDHDDVLDRDALFYVCEAINEMDPDVLYSDEDYLDNEGRRYRPNFKPDFSPDLLLSHNYITHLLVVRRRLLDACGMLNSDYDGAQDHDLVLRLSEYAESIVHIPKVLYHWRQSPASSSFDIAAKPYVQERARRVLVDTMKRRGIEADVLNANLPHFFYTRRRLQAPHPISVIIPFRDQPALLEKCLNSVLQKTTWSEYEVIGVNNQSTSPITYELMDAFRANPRVRFIDHDEAFNFSAIVNHGVAEARGEYVVLLNNDIEIITWQWLEELLCQALNEGTGAVGGKLFYPDNTVQHAGIVVGIDGYAGHGHKRFDCHAHGYGNRLQLVQNVSAVTGAFMMVNRALFESIDGFNETEFPVACNDVDFCLRLIEAGYWNVFTPYAQAYHLESATRGYEFTEEKRKRFEREKSVFRERHEAILDMGDPFYNVNLSLENESYSIRLPQSLETSG